MPNQVHSALLHTMSGSELSRVRTELYRVRILPAIASHPVQPNGYSSGCRKQLFLRRPDLAFHLWRFPFEGERLPNWQALVRTKSVNSAAKRSSIGIRRSATTSSCFTLGTPSGHSSGSHSTTRAHFLYPTLPSCNWTWKAHSSRPKGLFGFAVPSR